LRDQIFDQIPEHAFWDIKTPLRKRPMMELNPINPAKPKTAITFFEIVRNDEYLHNKEACPNTKTGVSTWTRY
jgi:hypothetical protein